MSRVEPPVPGHDPPDVTDAPSPTMEQVTALVDRARDGDRDAFGMLFETYHDEIYRFAARRVGEPALAQDIAAETFADAFAGIHRFHWRGVPFEAWLYKIARRRVADAFRAQARDAGQTAAHDPTPDHGDEVSTAIQMRAAIQKLPRSERDVIELRFMEDLDVDATARRLGKRPGAVRVAQHRAIAKLRSLMESER